ncbi:CLUMA_CG021090, isoform A [Clunio marinus]|uniref:CLUMA_CG021090, isoform A n=1 Tax=Clunio marinus TaxID=568069 RepID=A0A1J1JAQ3_9DIPT|nr:CLUMA_CG021090, isoform A [Clunio marinus]
MDALELLLLLWDPRLKPCIKNKYGSTGSLLKIKSSGYKNLYLVLSFPWNSPKSFLNVENYENCCYAQFSHESRHKDDKIG